MVVLVMGHVDITITGFTELDVVGGVEVIKVAAAVFGAKLRGFLFFSIYIVFYLFGGFCFSS